MRAAVAAVLAVLATLALPAAATADWRVVRFDHRITAADRAALDRAGAQSAQYRPRNSYVAWLPKGARVRGAAVRPLPRRARVSDALAGAAAAQVVAFDHGVRLSRRLPGVPGPRALARLLRDPRIMWIGPAPSGLFAEDEGTAQILAGNVSDGAPEAGYPDWLRGLGIDGSGVRVSIVDTGVDGSHPDLAPRVLERVYSHGATGTAGGHGTHVAGIVAGNATTEETDSEGLLMGHGVAPGAQIIDHNALAGPFPPEDKDFSYITRPAVERGSVAWNASWHTGEGAGVGYLETARNVDTLVRDADPTAPGEQPFTMVFSAGNNGSGASSLTSPKEAKNIITVAASNSHKIDYELGSTEQSDIDTIASFSSRGPAVDGRILPTVAAPGQAVVSTRIQSDPTASDCTLPLEAAVADPEPLAFPHYGYCSGTSMAAPHVTGAVALIVHAWRTGHGGATPSPAMVKAQLVNSATDMGAPDVPNNDEGWGRVNVGALLSGGARHAADQERVLTDPGACAGLVVAAADPSRPLKATLAWTDAPGAPDANPALVNDLDLTVSGAEAYLGNVFSGGASTAGGEPDRVSNLENVFVARPSGSYEVVVTAANVPGDGVPSGGDTTDQDFALVVSNAAVQGPVARCEPPAPAPAATPPRKSRRNKASKARAKRRCLAKARRVDSPKRRRAAQRRCRRAHRR